MPWLFLLACVMLVVGEAWGFFVARKRMQALFRYVEAKFPEVYARQLAGAKPSDRVTGDFLRSADDFGDAELARLKRRALFANKLILMPLLVVLALMVVIYVASSILGLMKG